MTHILVGVCHREDRLVSADWTYGIKSLGMPLGSSFIMLPVYGSDVAGARNLIAQRAIDERADYVFFNDDDVILSQDTMHLIHRSQKNLKYTYGASHEFDMVTGVYWGKGFPPEPLIFRSEIPGDWDWRGPYHDWMIGDFIEVDAAGCGAVLIPTEVFRRMEKPWFRLDYGAEYEKKGNDVGTTEDLLFYRRAREEAGISLWCDTWIQLGHFDRNRQLIFRAPPDAIQMRQRFEIVEGAGTLVHIGAGADLRQFPEFTNVVRIDKEESYKPHLISQYHSVPLNDGIADTVFSYNILNIYPMDVVREVLLEWIRLLKIGGILHIAVPDLELAMQSMTKGGSIWPIYGGVDKPFRTGFTKSSIAAILKSVKLEIEKIWNEEGDHMISIRAKKTKEY